MVEYELKSSDLVPWKGLNQYVKRTSGVYDSDLNAKIGNRGTALAIYNVVATVGTLGVVAVGLEKYFPVLKTILEK